MFVVLKTHDFLIESIYGHVFQKSKDMFPLYEKKQKPSSIKKEQF